MTRLSTKSIGVRGEDIACQFLRQKGYGILERNYTQPWGEIDIIALKDRVVHFVEVKAVSVPTEMFSRESSGYMPEEQIHKEKLHKIARTAELYMHSTKDKREYQIDAVGVLMDTEARRARCRLFEQIL